MGRPTEWMTELTGRSPMRSPGAPSHRREVEREFWREIAKGLLPEEAAHAVGASQAVGGRWLRHGGGMSRCSWRRESAFARSPARWGARRRRSAGSCGATPPPGRKARVPGVGRTMEGRTVGPSTEGCEARQQPAAAPIRQERLSGQIQRPDGTPVTGPPAVPWTGRNKPHRKDRAWVQAWSPEQIANRIKVDFPDDESMRISHEAIYQALYIEGPRCAETRAHLVPAHRPGTTRPEGAIATRGVGARHP